MIADKHNRRSVNIEILIEHDDRAVKKTPTASTAAAAAAAAAAVDINRRSKWTEDVLG